MEEKKTSQEKAPWITYRPALKVLDCTVRDGGLINNHQFPDDFVRAVYDTCLAAGIDTMEIGYKNSERLFPRDQFGAWRHCREDDIRRVLGEHDTEGTGLTLSAMADAGKSDWKTAIEPAAGSGMMVSPVTPPPITSATLAATSAALTYPAAIIFFKTCSARLLAFPGLRSGE